MKRILVLSASLLVAMPASAGEVYRWTDPETGQVVTTPTLPPYPIKEKTPAGVLPGGDLVKVLLDENSPPVKSALAKRQAEETARRHAEEAKEKAKAKEKAAKEAKEAKERQEQTEQQQLEKKKWDEQVERAKEQLEKRRAESTAKKDQVCTGDPHRLGVKIGMSKEDFQLCFDMAPDHINNTTTAAGTREQWVYSFGKEMRIFYFTNGILTAIQD